MAINRSLLLENAIIFKDSTLIDNIHQSVIDLQLNPQKNQVQNLFNRTFSYLKNNIDYKTLEEISFLILSCISQNDENKKGYINQIFKNSKKNENNLVLLSILYPLCKDLHFYPDSKQIINDIIKQIAIQILNPKDKFTIFDLDINEIYRTNLIADIILTIKLPEKVESTFFPYILTKENFSQRKKLKILQKASANNCVSFLPEILLTQKCIFDLFSQKNLSLIIPKMTKQTFLKILPFIKNNFSETKVWEESFSLSILEKCVEFNINFIFIYKMNQILESIQKSELKYSVYEYLIKNEKNFSDKFTGKIIDWSINPSILKTGAKLENIPINILVQYLSQIDDFELFERISNVKFNVNDIVNIDICSKKQFWIHIFTVISNSKQKCSNKLLNFLATLFKKNLKPKNIYEMFDAMIFDKFPTNQYGNYFIFDFINKFNIKHKTYIMKKDKIIEKIVDQKTIPLLSFWNFFDSSCALQYINSKSINPKNYCLFSTEEIKALTIQQGWSDFNQNLLIETLKTCDITKLKNLDEDLMQLISNIIIYLNNQKDNIEIQGLTYDNILPFLALSLIYYKESGGSMVNISKEFETVLLKSCQLSTETNSLLIIESINLIMSLIQYVFDQSFFPSKLAFEMMDIYINQLIDKTYKADTIVLLQSIINLQKIHTNPNVQCLFDKNGILIIKFIIQNLSKIENCDKLKNHKIDLKIIDQDRLLNEIFSSTTNYYDAIYFFENFCINMPNKISTISNKLVKLLKNSLKKNEFETFSFIYNFIKKNHLVINAKEIFSVFQLTNANAESFTKVILNQNLPDNMICEIFYNILMKDTSIIMDYFSTLFDKISKNHILKPKNILKHYSEIYVNNKQNFVKALKNSYGFRSDQNIFIKKINNNNQLKYLKSSQSIIKKLLDEVSSGENAFQALFVLNYIASYFPFLFIINPEKIFITVLPKMTSFSLLFSSSIDINIQSIKLNLLALNFLFSTLYSIHVLESFVLWILNNILSFDCSQILSFTFILYSLFKTKKVKDAMLSLMIKNNFVDIAYHLLEIEVPDEIFHIYKENVYKLLIEYYKNLNKLQHKKKLILID